MPTEPAYIRNFKALARANPQLSDLPKLEAEIYGTNDRARAVMLSAIVETALTIFLRNQTRPTLNGDDTRLLFDWSGPLGEFASKILVGYAFNLFGPKTRRDLDLIRLIRNEFAHSRVSFDFTTPPVAAVCAQLGATDWPGSFIPRAWLEARGITRKELGARIDKKHPRTRFISSCHVISERFLSQQTARPLDLP